MKTRIITALAPATLALSMHVATAGEIGGARVMDGASPGHLRLQQQVSSEPGYGIGTGVGYIGDESDPAYEATLRMLRTTPGYLFGEGGARVHYLP